MAKKSKKAKKKAVRPAGKKSVNRPAAKATKVAPKRKTAKPAKSKSAKPTATGRAALMSVAPGFTVKDAVASVAWYQDVLGFAVQERWESEGQFRGAAMRSGSVTINLGQDDWKLGRDRVKGQGTRMYITTGPDIDAYADQIKARGGTLDQEPSDGWGMRMFAITDPDGFKLTFMTKPKK